MTGNCVPRHGDPRRDRVGRAAALAVTAAIANSMLATYAPVCVPRGSIRVSGTLKIRGRSGLESTNTLHPALTASIRMNNPAPPLRKPRSEVIPRKNRK